MRFAVTRQLTCFRNAAFLFVCATTLRSVRDSSNDVSLGTDRTSMLSVSAPRLALLRTETADIHFDRGGGEVKDKIQNRGVLKRP